MRFSIVTPSYNQADWLRLCVASVGDQVTRGPGGEQIEVEHIVQDAGTPGIERIAEGRMGEPHGLRVVVEKDRGMYDAINLGLRKATGEVCGYLNCDEQYLPGTLARVAALFAENPELDLLFGDAVLVDEGGHALSYRQAIAPNRVHIRLAQLNVLTCAMFFRRSLVERGFLFNPEWKVIGDAEWVWRLLGAGVRFRVLNEPLSVFTFTGANLSEADRGPASEQRRWAALPDAPPRGLRGPAILKHRAAKWLAGGYRRRDVRYEIYTRESPDARREFISRGIGARWPVMEK